MPHHIKIKPCHHLALLREVGANISLNVSTEMSVDSIAKQRRRMIHRHARAVGSDHIMDRADDVIRGERRIARTVGICAARNEVRLHAAQHPDAVRVFRRLRADVGEVVRELRCRHRAGAVVGISGMRRESDLVEPLIDGRKDDGLGIVLPVAPDRMRMVVRFHARAFRSNGVRTPTVPVERPDLKSAYRLAPFGSMMIAAASRKRTQFSTVQSRFTFRA